MNTDKNQQVLIMSDSKEKAVSHINTEEAPEKIKVYKYSPISIMDDMIICESSIDKLLANIRAHLLDDSFEPGELKIIIGVTEMTKEEFDNLPEFDGY